MREEGEVKVPVSYAGVTRIRFDGSALNLSAQTGPPTVRKAIAGVTEKLKIGVTGNGPSRGNDCETGQGFHA